MSMRSAIKRILYIIAFVVISIVAAAVTEYLVVHHNMSPRTPGMLAVDLLRNQRSSEIRMGEVFLVTVGVDSVLYLSVFAGDLGLDRAIQMAFRKNR
jgi:hypothetical protein